MTTTNASGAGFGATDSSNSALGITAERRGAALMLSMTRAERLNAIGHSMREALAGLMEQHARDPNIYAGLLTSSRERVFSVGGDMRELLAAADQSDAAAAEWIAEECRLIWQADCFSRPVIALIDGVTMGTGAGLARAMTHQVAGEGYALQMPETAIGLVPDVGMAHTFGRMEGHVGAYLALTGRAVGRADALALGLVSHCIPRHRFVEIELAVADAQPIDPVLDDRHEDPGPGQIERYRSVIAACFSAATVAEIVDRLAASKEETDWCGQVRGDLLQRSPLASEAALRHVRLAASLDLRQTLIADHRLVSRLVARPDFRAGVTAVLIEKSGPPAWKPATLADVSDAMIAELMDPVNAGQLTLPTRAEMEAGSARP